MTRRSPYLAALAPALALLAGLLRWWMQGSRNLYTQTARRAYLPDPDLGWRVVDGGPPWLGLEVLGIVLGITCAVALGAWLLSRADKPRPKLRLALVAIGLVPLAVPIWAFAGGFGADGARDRLPANAAANVGEGVHAALDAPAGRWEVVPNPGSAITARVSAGGDEFDARFTGNLTGAWTGDPAHLDMPSVAEVSVDTASVDTGVTMRSKSARTEYLHADQFPQLSVHLERVTGADAAGADVTFSATGTVTLTGESQPVTVTGTLHLLDDAARARLAVSDGPAMLVAADFSLSIAATGFADAAGDFDGDAIPVHVSLVLVHRQGTP